MLSEDPEDNMQLQFRKPVTEQIKHEYILKTGRLSKVKQRT